MAIDFNAIRAKLDRLSGTSKNRSVMWRPTEGEEHTVRLLSFPENDGLPFKELWFYYNIGEQRGLLAPNQFGDPDPIQELINSLRDEGSKESYELCKKLYPKMRTYAPIIVRGEEDQGVRLWGFGKTAYRELLNLVLNPEYGDITDATEGTDLTINYGKPPGAQFPQTTITPRRKSSPLAETEEKIGQFLDQIPDYGSVFERKTPAQVQNMLDEFLLGEEDAEELSSETSKYDSSGQNSVDKAFKELLAS